jgi:hypothetical protein
LAEYTLKALENVGNSAFAASLLSSVFLRACKLWPDDVADLFSTSTVLYPAILDHLIHSVIFQAVNDLVDDHPIQIKDLMWHIFRALVGDEWKLDPIDRPRLLFLTKDLNYDSSRFSISHRVSAIEILKKYFAVEREREILKDFGQVVLKTLGAIRSFLPSMFELAKAIGPDLVLKNRAIDVVKSCEDQRSDVFCSAISYLSACISLLPEIEIEQIMARALIGGDPSKNCGQFAWLHIISLVTELTQPPLPECFDHFRKVARQIIVVAWNKVVMNEKNAGAIGPLLQIAVLIRSDSELWEGTAFYRCVLAPWVSLTCVANDKGVTLEQPIDYNMRIPESLADEGLIAKLWHFEAPEGDDATPDKSDVNDPE